MNVDNPRWISAGEYYGSAALSAASNKVVDLGMVSARDAAIYGRTRPLIPFAEGRLISAIRFVPGGTPPGDLSNGLYFVTPNTNLAGDGDCFAEYQAGIDTLGVISGSLQTSIKADHVAKSQILDSGPLFAIYDYSGLQGFAVGTWQANTPYCVGDLVLGSDHIRQVETNGVSGSTEPVWLDDDTTIDGTVAWADYGLPPEGEAHAVVEVIEGVSPMPQYPVSLEFVVPPVDGVAGEPLTDFSLIMKDQYGQPYTFAGVELGVEIFGVGMIDGGAPTTDPANGVGVFTGITISDPGTYILRIRTALVLTADPIFSDPFDITAP